MLMLTRRMQKEEAKAKAAAVLGGGGKPSPVATGSSKLPAPATKKAAANKLTAARAATRRPHYLGAVDGCVGARRRQNLLSG